jgi:hypothetical protein
LVEAQLVQINLESMGIDTTLKKDDAGGGYPSLQLAQSVQLLVDPEDGVEAKKIRDEYTAEEVVETQKEKGASKFPGWGYFVLGVALGIILATTDYMAFHKIARSLK